MPEDTPTPAAKRLRPLPQGPASQNMSSNPFGLTITKPSAKTVAKPPVVLAKPPIAPFDRDAFAAANKRLSEAHKSDAANEIKPKEPERADQDQDEDEPKPVTSPGQQLPLTAEALKALDLANADKPPGVQLNIKALDLANADKPPGVEKNREPVVLKNKKRERRVDIKQFRSIEVDETENLAGNVTLPKTAREKKFAGLRARNLARESENMNFMYLSRKFTQKRRDLSPERDEEEVAENEDKHSDDGEKSDDEGKKKKSSSGANEDDEAAAGEKEEGKINVVWPAHRGNEDRIFSFVGTVGEEKKVDWFISGVCDGHDGAQAATTVAEFFPDLVLNDFRQRGTSPAAAMKKAAEHCEFALWGQKISSGTCMNAVLCWGRYLYCAQVGDCDAKYVPLSDCTSSKRARGDGDRKKHLQFGRLNHLSVEQSCRCEAERARLARAGITDITAPPHNGRLGGLQPTRSIGDYDAKCMPRVNGALIYEPETRCIDLFHEASVLEKCDLEKVEQCCGLLVQGTDGAFDFLKNADIPRIALKYQSQLAACQQFLYDHARLSPRERNRLSPAEEEALFMKQSTVLSDIAKDLADIAYQLSDGGDDTSVLVTMLYCGLK
ncbi:unnamed protein product [Amoebophrya sp. A120]|nr:unnamed protein product [Amoebophrya sp. A120]|eukprot:GSA120T00009892001.1